MKYKQGQHLTEVVYEFRPLATISIKEAEEFLNKAIKILKVTETHRHINNLPPGYDILCGLKESCIYLGYWPEHQYMRLIASSCKQFNKDKVSKLIIEYFRLETKVIVTLNCDCAIKSKVEDLWC